MSSQNLNLKKTINRLILFIGLGVGAHIIFVLMTTERALLNYLSGISYTHLILIFFLMHLPWIFYALRVFMWALFLKEKIRYFDLIRVVITADLASALSPTAVGGAPVKAALLINRGFSSGNVGFLLTYGVIEDIIFYLTGIVLAGFFSANLLSNISSNLIVFLKDHDWHFIIATLVIVGYIYLLRKNHIPVGFRLITYIPDNIKSKIYHFRSKLAEGLVEMKSNFKMAVKQGKLRMLASFTMLLLQWMAKFSVLIVILDAFEVDFETIQIYIRQWVIYVTMLFIPTPGASGGAEASFLLIFGKSIPSDLSFLIVSVWRLFTYYLILLSAVVFYSVISIFLSGKDEDISMVMDKDHTQ
jgi:glycosyltransferase 2 family protein